MCWLEFRFYPLLGAADLPFNADAGIIIENMMCEKTFHRSGTILLENRNTEAIQSRLQIETLIQRNHLRSFSAVASVSEFQFFTWRRWPRRSTIILE